MSASAARAVRPPAQSSRRLTSQSTRRSVPLTARHLASRSTPPSVFGLAARSDPRSAIRTGPWLLAVTVAAAVVVWCATADGAAVGEAFHFDAQAKSLTIDTDRLELTILGGAVVAVRDTATGEAFSGGATWSDLSRAATGFSHGPDPAAASRPMGGPAAPSGPPVALRPDESSAVEFQRKDPRIGVLIYRQLAGAKSAADAAHADAELRLAFRVEDDGELSFRLEARTGDPARAIRDTRFPLVGLTAQAVILGSGERFARGDAAAESRCVRIANNIYSPAVGVVEGRRGVLGIWPEPAGVGYDDLSLRHAPEADELVAHIDLNSGQNDPDTVDEPGVARGSWWRLAALPGWLDVARRYREHLEQRTGVKPLWEQSPTWVRAIHAVCNERPGINDPAVADKFYADLAARFDPQNLLLFYWNGNCILLFGDHRYMTELQYPKPAEIEALGKHGFRWMGYHPYTLIFSPLGRVKHLDEARSRGFGVPADYTFQPDYAGPPGLDAFYDYFRSVATGYYAPQETSPSLWVLHPGAAKVRDYLTRNVGGYCREHGMSGCYFDILGADHASHFVQNAPQDRRIIEGRDWRRGEEEACRAIKAANPELAMMSEVQSEWTTIHTFYTWEGESHLTHPQPVRLNHPLRAACWGSYTWTRTDSPEAVALSAGLPAVTLDDQWTIARARLYCDELLFHDLPSQWDPVALAYLRGKDDRWFQYRRMDWGYAYVESDSLHVRLGRLVRQREFPVPGPAWIQHWAAYRDGRPIGLSPTQTYDFMMQPPPNDDPVWLTSLPAGASIRAIRHGEGQSVIELAAAEPIDAAQVEVAFHRDCLSVHNGALDHSSPFAAGTSQIHPGPFAADTSHRFTTRLPGGLVFVWQAPRPPADGTLARSPAASGHVRANGLPYQRWTYNSLIRHRTFQPQPAGASLPVLELGAGLKRAWCDHWLNLADQTNPVLHFDVIYPPGDDQQSAAPSRRKSRSAAPRPLVWSVLVDGGEVWRERVEADAAPRARQIPLSGFAERTVLVTFSAEEEGDTDVVPTHLLTPARFGNIRMAKHLRPTP